MRRPVSIPLVTMDSESSADLGSLSACAAVFVGGSLGSRDVVGGDSVRSGWAGPVGFSGAGDSIGDCTVPPSIDGRFSAARRLRATFQWAIQQYLWTWPSGPTLTAF